MTLENMAIEKFGDESAFIFRKQVVLTGTQSSNALILPYFVIYAISVNTRTTGTVTVYVTNSSEDEIEADTAVWVAWDGSSAFPLGITAMKVINGSGSSTVDIVVKTGA